MNAPTPLTVGSLFAGIGGFDLGFERAGMQTVWQVEQNPYCLAVLAKHFPQAQRFTDVCEVGSHNLPSVDVICGGFPCQDLSYAGKGAGIDGSRSGLWAEYARIVGELRPRYVIVENVPALLGRGLERVLGDLASLGYDAEWDCLPASAFGAPHRRDRFWLVAYPGSQGRRQDTRGAHGDEAADAGRAEKDDHLTLGAGPSGVRAAGGREDGAVDPNAYGGGCKGRPQRDGQPQQPGGSAQERSNADGLRDALADTNSLAGTARGPCQGGSEALPRSGSLERAIGCGGCERHPWEPEPDVGRVADGIPSRVDRLSALGNALVPQIAEWIGRRILEFESALQDRQA